MIALADADIHQQLIEAAEPLGSMLVAALIRSGPVSLPGNSDNTNTSVNGNDGSYYGSGNFAGQLCRAVAGQQLSVAAAKTIWARVQDGVGDRPLIEYLLAAEPEELRSYGLSGNKAKAMRSIAEAEAAGRISEEALATMNAAQRAERLTEIWGIGQWTADMMSIFYFADPDVWPDGDLVVRKTLEQLTSKRRSTIRSAERFKPYRSYLAMQMWQIADAKLF